MKRLLTFTLALGLVWALCGTVYGGDIIHVPGDQPTIQAGIDAAEDGDIVLVADDTYSGDGNKNLDFGGRAITVKSENGPENCIIDCEYDGRGFYFHNNEGEDSVVSGFTIINGSSGYLWNGNAIYNSSSSPTITNCTFSGNYAMDGGAIYNSVGSSPTITNCTFSGNNAGSGGAAIYNSSSSPTITNCTFSGNNAHEHLGGAIFNIASSPTIADCTFSGNYAMDGGAIFNRGSSPTITNCTFSGNYAMDGGAIYNSVGSSPTITNCTFSGNYAGSGGAAICNTLSSPTITNCTFSGNNAPEDLGGAIFNARSSPTITNCILWADSPDEIFNSDFSDPTVTFSDIEGGYPGEGNIDADPLFVDSGNGDYHLQPDSPCIDAGTNDAPELPDTDFEGDPRIIDGDNDGTATVDMGADEFPGLPVADFSADPVSGTTPLTVTFTDESTGMIDTWEWDFGDGETSIEENPTHTYTDEGIYTVSLSASGPHGSDTEVKLGYITVSEPDDDDGGGGGGCFISIPLLGIFRISEN